MNKSDVELTIRERLKKFLDERRISYCDFLEKTQLSNSFLRVKNQSITSDIIATILKDYPELNSDWLVTGRGRMLKPYFEFSTMKIVKKGTELKAEMSLEQIINIQEELARCLYLTIFDQNEQLKKKDAIICELEKKKESQE